MPAHRPILTQLLLSLAVCFLCCAVLSAELPELMSLSDDASNDFTIHKTSSREYAKAASAAIHKYVPRNVETFDRAACSPFREGAETISSSLFLLHSVLRR
jgi:hypothetical protein